MHNVTTGLILIRMPPPVGFRILSLQEREQQLAWRVIRFGPQGAKARARNVLSRQILAKTEWELQQPSSTSLFQCRRFVSNDSLTMPEEERSAKFASRNK